MMAENGRKNDLVLLALAAGLTVHGAAERAGCSQRTVYRYLANADFQRRLTEARGEMVGRALGRLADAMTEAADTLRSLLAAESEAVRLGAARSTLELGSRLRESVELEKRISALEERQKESLTHA